MVMFGNLPNMKVINYIINLIKHFFITSFTKKILKKNIGVNCVNIVHVDNIGSLQAQGVYSCFSARWFTIVNSLLYVLLSVSNCFTHYKDYFVIVIWTITKRDNTCKQLILHVKYLRLSLFGLNKHIIHTIFKHSNNNK